MNESSKHILIVDDEPEILELTRNLLLKHSFEVSTAMNGLAAFVEIQKHRPQLILLDVLMPEMDGYTFYKKLKDDPLTCDIPVLIVTGRGQMADAFEVLGVDGFIPKPYTPEVLIERIRSIMGAVERSAPSDHGFNVLLIGPREIVGHMAEQARRAGWKAKMAATGTEALTAARDFDADIIVTDIQLDDMDGEKIIQRLRRLKPTRSRPLIGYCYYPTASLAQREVRRKVLAIQETSRRFLSGGADVYIGRYRPKTFLENCRRFTPSAADNHHG